MYHSKDSELKTTWLLVNIIVNTECQHSQISAAGLYNPFLVYCRELAPSTVRLTGDLAQGDDSKHDSNYSYRCTSIMYLRNRLVK